MSRRFSARSRSAADRLPSPESATLAAAALPLGALLLAGSASALAQSPAASAGTLNTVTVTEQAEAPEGKDAVRATETSIGKGRQLLRDIPQSLTVVTEKVMDDRNLDTMKEVLKTTGGISFLAAEGGEEDIRLRGFSLQGTGDVFVDGLRDPAFYERDTFSLDRLEVLRGSASMLFGRGSTGGAVNMVNKVPRLIDENAVDVTVGSHAYRRIVGDFNTQTSDNSALRVGVMATEAKNNGAGSSLSKRGIAAGYRWGIGEADEFSASLYHLDNNNGIHYGLPWIRPTATSAVGETTVVPLDPTAYYGMASDRNHGSASHLTLTHTHRFDHQSELTTKVRHGRFDRDQRASAIRFTAATSLKTFDEATALRRGNNAKIQDLQATYAQSDYSSKFSAWGLQHDLQAGADVARERRRVYAASAVTKPPTTVGTPHDSAWLNEDARTLSTSNTFDSTSLGVYVQDLVQVAPHWKLLGGLRYDRLKANYHQYAANGTVTANPSTDPAFNGKPYEISEFSQRLGVLYQPNEWHSFHASAATSFNTSADSYSVSANQNGTPPEKSINLEVGAKLDSADKQWTTRLALFRATKLHERNTDPLVPLLTLSGKRHVAGFEMDVAGRLTPKWEVFASYIWMPVANIDEGVAGSEGEGTRPSLIPVHSGSVWTTYQLSSRLRLGAGLNFRGKQTPNRNPGWTVPAWVTGDLMAEYKVDFDRLTLKANLTNVTNRLYADQLYSGHYVPGPGRQLQVTANLKF